jgi:hypothetical protein
MVALRPMSTAPMRSGDLAAGQRECAVIVGHAHRAIDIAEARRRRIDHHAIAPVAAAHVLHHQLVAHQDRPPSPGAGWRSW